MVSGIKDNNGHIRCGLFNSAATFPKDEQKYQGVEAPIANGQATCTFANVPPGTYAVAYYKAAPGQTKMNTGMFGSPADPYGFSRNATIGMGPPSFNAAAYSYAGGNTSLAGDHHLSVTRSSRAEPPEGRRSRGTCFVDAATNRSLHYASLRSAPVGMTDF